MARGELRPPGLDGELVPEQQDCVYEVVVTVQEPVDRADEEEPAAHHSDGSAAFCG